MNYQNIHHNIKRIALERGISQSKLSELSGVDFTYINRIFQNKTNASVKTLIKLCLALDCKFDDLLK